MEPAKLRFDECPQCGFGVDENDPDRGYCIETNGEFFHEDCHKTYLEDEAERVGTERLERSFRNYWGGFITQEDRDRQDLKDAGRYRG